MILSSNVLGYPNLWVKQIWRCWMLSSNHPNGDTKSPLGQTLTLNIGLEKFAQWKRKLTDKESVKKTKTEVTPNTVHGRKFCTTWDAPSGVLIAGKLSQHLGHPKWCRILFHQQYHPTSLWRWNGGAFIDFFPGRSFDMKTETTSFDDFVVLGNHNKR